MNKILLHMDRWLSHRRTGYLFLGVMAMVLFVFGHVDPAMAQSCDAGVLTRMGTMLSGAFSGFGQTDAATAVCSGAQTSIATLTGLSSFTVIGAGLLSWKQNDYTLIIAGVVLVAFIWLILFIASNLFLGAAPGTGSVSP